MLIFAGTSKVSGALMPMHSASLLHHTTGPSKYGTATLAHVVKRSSGTEGQ